MSVERPFDLVLFDLDGTLADTAGDLVGAVNHLRVQRGLPPMPLEILRPYASAGARGLIGAALDIHPGHAEFEDKDATDPLELKAKENDLNYVKLDGEVGIIGNGAGLVMSTLDVVAYAGEKHGGVKPANFLDIGGGATPERVAKAFKLVTMDKNVEAILVNIFAGINRCDWVAEGVVQALKAEPVDVPVIVRLSGTNVEEGQKILAQSGLPIIRANTLMEAAERGYYAYTNCTSALAEVVPFGGKFPTLGTNPHSWGFPTMDALGYPVVIDWATSEIAMGKVEQYKRENKKLESAFGVT